MPKFDANLSLLWTEVEFPDRFARARAAGFHAVEYQLPYAYEKERLADLLAAHDLTLVMHNLPAGDWAAGERGIACLPGREGEFQDGVGLALDYAAAQGARRLNCLAGVLPAGVDAEKARATLVENLRFAAAALKAAGLELLVEPLNTRDTPGFILNRSRQTLELLDAVGADNAFLQYDVYHMQLMEGDLTATLTRDLARIGHIQIADAPARGEPGSGEIHFPFLFEALDTAGYAGWIGAEYRPRAGTEAGLGWFAPYRG
ncbi:hydroxypyruvate isomerase [Xanthobacter sp. V4C-4]|uniref:hydroxypyruvate isomerase n=1 Tax=Xanthobacter cornucopiae TaxID=3119924 RepID=UPI00372CE299